MYKEANCFRVAPVSERRDTPACIRRHQAFAIAPVAKHCSKVPVIQPLRGAFIRARQNIHPSTETEEHSFILGGHYYSLLAFHLLNRFQRGPHMHCSLTR